MNESASYDEAKDLTDRVELLRQRLEEGKVHFAPHLMESFKESFLAIRVRDDGLVDPATVNGSIRALTSALRHQNYRNETKDAISLADIQDAYFRILETNFGPLYASMEKAGVTPSQFAYAFAQSGHAKELAGAVPDLVAAIREFWQEAGDAGLYHLQDMACLKATFGGDIFPRYDQNAVSSAGLYVDTIVLPCPILRLAGFLERDVSTSAIERLVKHILTAMGYRSVATADVSPPIAVILPGADEASESRADLFAIATPSIISHASHLFGRKFESMQHIGDFLEGLPTVDSVLKELRNPDRLVFDLELGLDPRTQLEHAMKMDLSRHFGGDHAGRVAMQSVVGRMPQAVDMRLKANSLGATPMITAETSWEHYKWHLEYQAASELDSETNSRLHIVRALGQDERTRWLGNVPPEVVIEIRRKNQAEELRAILSKGIESLVKISPTNFTRTSAAVADNIQREFERHQAALDEALSQKLKFYGVNVASSLAVGGIAVAAAITASPLLGSVSGILGIAGAQNLRELRSRYRELKEADIERGKSATALLFQHRDGTG